MTPLRDIDRQLLIQQALDRLDQVPAVSLRWVMFELVRAVEEGRKSLTPNE